MASGHARLEIGDRIVVLVPSTSIEHWPDDVARRRLQSLASQWPGRDALSRISSATLGPDDDTRAAIEHLAREFDRGWLLAMRIPDDLAGFGIARGEQPWDAPWLADLGADRRDDVDDSGSTWPGRGAQGSRRSRSSGAAAGPNADRTTDTWTTMVTYAVFDPHGNPLGGSSRCEIDGAAHDRPLRGAVTTIEPIAAHATIELTIADLSIAKRGSTDPGASGAT
jgi:hypothetical protein